MSPLVTWWKKISEGLWFIPGLFALGSVALAVLAVRVDQSLLRELDLPVWLFYAGAEGARGVLSAIAGSLITVTGVVFSVTIVALQLASSQFTPRVLRNFTSDRGNQVVLGVFIGTFTYSLLVLRTVRSSAEGRDAFVPSLSVTLAVLLTLVSVGFLIYFIDHLARSIQVEQILQRVAEQTIQVIERLSAGDPPAGSAEPKTPPGEPWVLTSAGAGYLQAVDHAAIAETAREGDLLVQVEVSIGEFVLEGTPIARVWPAEAAGEAEEVRDELRSAFVLGIERTPHQDIGRGVLEMVDIAVKALSPGINDPTTSIVAVDRITEVLLVLARRETGRRVTRDEQGDVRVVSGRISFESVVDDSFGAIAVYAADHPRVLRHMLRRLGDLATLVAEPHIAPLRRQADEILARAELDSGTKTADLEEEDARLPWRASRRE